MIPTLRTTLLTICLALPAKAENLTVFAAASMGDAMGDLADAWETKTGQDVTLVFAGSATLARQIDSGAPADVFVSANADWMDWLDTRGRIVSQSRMNTASNSLVLVAHDPAVGSDAEVTPQTDIAAALGPDGRLAVALPDAVPAGIYAKAALSDLGLWTSVRTRLAPTDNVRAALALVALGEAPFGVVYATDAQAEPRVVIAGTLPERTHPLIRYPAAVVADSGVSDAAEAFVDWLAGADAQAVLAQFGFLPPDPGS